jgi:hypothetical protein
VKNNRLSGVQAVKLSPNTFTGTNFDATGRIVTYLFW